MARKNRMKEYFIDSNGKLREMKASDIEKFQVEKVAESNQVSAIDNIFNVNNQEIGIEKSVAKFNEMSRTNPFLYNYNLDSTMSLYSIEDFYIKRGKKEISFRNLVRTNVYRKAKRRKILKRAFKEWNEDVNQKLMDLQNYGTVQYNNNKWMILPKIKKISFIFNIIGFLFSVLLLNASIEIIGPVEGLFKQLTYLSVLIFIAILFIGALLNKIINTNARVFKRNKQYYNSEVSKVLSDYKRKFKKTTTYYLKNMPANPLNFKKEILLLDETSIQFDNIKKVESIVADGSKQLIKSNKRSGGVKFSKFLYMFLLVCASLYVYGYAIYKIAVYFIGKINN